jgi:hypothetical protein
MRVTDEFGLETYVAVFSLGEQRMFLPISGDYQVSSGLCTVVTFIYLVVIQGHAQTDCRIFRFGT